MLYAVVLVLSSAALIQASELDLQIEPQSSEPRQYFTLLGSRPTFNVHVVHPVQWLHEQSTVLDHIVNTFLGVHPCAYQSWGNLHIWPAHDVQYLYDDSEYDNYTEEESQDHAYNLGRRFGMFNTDSRQPINVLQLMAAQLMEDGTGAAHEQNRELFSDAMRGVEIEDLDDVFFAGTAAQLRGGGQEPQLNKVLAIDMQSNNAMLNSLMANGVPAEVRSQLVLDAAMQRANMQQVAEAGLIDGIVVEEVGLWEGLRSASAWGVMLFLVLVAACMLVWGAFITTCFALRDPAYQQFKFEEREENNLLEPLCQNEYSQPQMMYSVNPAYRRQ